MTLKEFLRHAIDLAETNPAAMNMQMYAIHGASGDVSEIGYMHVTDRVSICGPFDLDPGEKYIDVYVGN